jgi:hypothetical protein
LKEWVAAGKGGDRLNMIEGSGVGGGGWRWNGHVGIQSLQGCKVKKNINRTKTIIK